MTPCWNRTCSTASPPGTTWIPPSRNIWASGPSITRMSAARGAKQITFNQVDVDRAAEYAAEDADVTLQLHQVLWAAARSAAEAEEPVRNDRATLGPRAVSHGTDGACWSIETCSGSKARNLRLACWNCRRKRTPKRAGHSMSTRRSSCRRFSSSNWEFRSSGKPRPDSRRPRRMCWRNWPPPIRCRS